jgi:GT2 family glycosyltransferase
LVAAVTGDARFGEEGATPSVYVIMPNKNGMRHLSYSLPSLFNTTYRNFHVVLVDDGSTDDSPGFVAREYPNVLILENRRGKGFAGSVNTGIEHALANGAGYVAVCNSDVKVLPEWLGLALPTFAKGRAIGLVGFTEITRDREELFYTAAINEQAVVARSVERLAGCLYLCPTAVFRRIGLYDEAYFMYGEDSDLFLRLIAAGYQLLETNIPVWHFGEGASPKRKLLTTWLAYRNAIRVSVKNESAFGVLRMVASLANQGCNPFLHRSAGNPNFSRLRRYSPVVNIFLLLASCAWNLGNLGSTLAARDQRA